MRRWHMLGLMCGLLGWGGQGATAQAGRLFSPGSPKAGYAGLPVYHEVSGVYKGFSGCADCSAIAVRLELRPSPSNRGTGTFVESRSFVGLPDRTAAGVKVSPADQAHGTWMVKAATGSEPATVCLHVAGTRADTVLDCYRIRESELVSLDGKGQELKDQPHILVKMIRMPDGQEYPVPPVSSDTR